MRARFPLMLGASALLATLIFAPPTSYAMSPDGEVEESLVGYDDIVRELSVPASAGSSSARQETSSDPFENVLLHGGVGLASTLSRVVHDGKPLDLAQQGLQAALGIDLFSRHWLAEGTARSLSGSRSGSERSELKEFDLKIYFRDQLTSKLGLRLGGGISARYLTITRGGALIADYATPATVAALGLDYSIGRSVSFGAELSSRNTLIDETIDRSSLDAVMRVDTHF